MQDIWQKTAKLISTSGLVVPVPGQPPSSHNRIVASAHGEPHHITCKSSGQFLCSGICPRFSSYKICQHTVAAAKVTNNLNKFCQWWRMQRHTADIESLAMSGLPTGIAGQKSGIAKWSRRGRSRSSTVEVPIRTYDRTSHVTNVQSLTASGPSTMNFGSVPSLSAMPQSSFDHGGMPSGTFNSLSHAYGSGSYGPLWGDSMLDNYVPPMGTYDPPFSSTSHGTSSSSDQWSSFTTNHGISSRSTMGQSTNNCQQYSPHGAQPYRLKFLTRQIRVCAGCRFGYCNTEKIPAPPYDMCCA